MHRIVAVLLASFVTSFAFADMPTLTVQDDDGSVALELSAVAIHTTVRGHLARTELTLTYRNSLDRIVGGDFQFPLPPDAEVAISVSGSTANCAMASPSSGCWHVRRTRRSCIAASTRRSPNGAPDAPSV